MVRTALIYLAVLSFAEALFAHPSHASENQVVFETMKPVHADGKGIPPKIMDFTKDPDADKPVVKQPKKLVEN